MDNLKSKIQNPKLCHLLVVVGLMIFVYLPKLGTSVANAQQNQVEQKLSWSDIWQQLQQKKPTVMPIGDICAIAPGWQSETKTVWNLRPMFVWNGILSYIEVHPSGSKEVLWRQKLAKQEYSALYDGEPLQLGQTYELLMFNPAVKTPNPTQRVSFQIVDVVQYRQIEDQITTMEAELKAQGLNKEHIALQRANYFIEHELWSDALQTILSVKNPSAELRNVVKQLPQFCHLSGNHATS